MLRLLALGLLIATARLGLAQEPDALPRMLVSLEQRRLWVTDAAGDTIYTAPVAIGSGRTLRTAEQTWTFRTPRGETVVTGKEVAPLWVPPDWHYVELGRKLDLRIERLRPDTATVRADGTQLVVRGGMVGVLGSDSVFRALPVDEEIILDGTLFIPPFGTSNRRVAGVLGPYRLRLANGVGLHGTPDQASIGKAVTHGCIRLYDADITWLYMNVPVGARVTIF